MKDELTKIRKLLEFLVKKEISKEIESLSEREREIYDLTGELGQTEIKNKLKVAPNTISDTWKKLEIKGLLRKIGKGYEKVI